MLRALLRSDSRVSTLETAYTVTRPASKGSHGRQVGIVRWRRPVGYWMSWVPAVPVDGPVPVRLQLLPLMVALSPSRKTLNRSLEAPVTLNWALGTKMVPVMLSLLPLSFQVLVP